MYFRLYSLKQWSKLEAHQEPEMLRSPLESLCLQVKVAMGGDSAVQDVLSRALSPPSSDTVTGALRLLQQRQALDSQQQLTPLGHFLTQMPLEPAVGAWVLSILLIASNSVCCRDEVQ